MHKKADFDKSPVYEFQIIGCPKDSKDLRCRKAFQVREPIPLMKLEKKREFIKGEPANRILLQSDRGWMAFFAFGPDEGSVVLYVLPEEAHHLDEYYLPAEDPLAKHMLLNSSQKLEHAG